MLKYNDHEFYPKRVVGICTPPSYESPECEIGDAAEQRIIALLKKLGFFCRVSKHMWLVETDESTSGIWQDIHHGGNLDNLFVFDMLVGTDWRLSIKHRGPMDANEFDGLATFFQKMS